MVEWIKMFGGLSSLPQEIQEQLVQESLLLRVPSGHLVFGPGKTPENMLLLLSGTVRVHQTTESGREIVLYRVEAGQSCIMTTSCLLSGETYSAEGITETEIEAIAIPGQVFDNLIAQSQEFRSFVFASYSNRIFELLRVIDEVAFGRIDTRLAQRLLALAGNDDKLDVTHQQLAIELGSAREVISRQLHEFQRRGWISLGRREIVLKNRHGLSSQKMA